MTLYNLGSINVDHFYRLAHLPAPGETLAATDYTTGLGGKGANQSVAVARAGSQIVHIGTVGADGRWAVERLSAYGVDVRHVAESKTPTGHAIITIDNSGENAIVLFPGSNRKQSLTRIKTALSGAKPGDILLLQNETNLQPEAAREAKSEGLRVIYSAAPFDAQSVGALLPHVDILVMNDVESRQLADALDLHMEEIPVPQVVITKGADGSFWRDRSTGETVVVPAFPVTPVDTTAAGDCFIGYVAAGLDEGYSIGDAMRLGAAASALKVTRAGTADAIPSRNEVDLFLAERGPE